MELKKRQIMDALSYSEQHDPEENELNYEYVDPETGRQFAVRVSDGRHLLEEMRPTGRCFKEIAGCPGELHYWTDDDLKALIESVGPNEFAAEARKKGFDPAAQVFVGAGHSVNTIYFDSLDECATQVVSSLAENKYFSPYRELGDDEKASLAQAEQIKSAQYWQWRQVVATAALRDSGLFKGCHDMSGNPLRDDTKACILSYLNSPGQERWHDIRGFLITASATLWQAWTESDPSAPRSGNDGFPSPAALRDAIVLAIQANQDEIERRLSGCVRLELEAVGGPEAPSFTG